MTEDDIPQSLDFTFEQAHSMSPAEATLLALWREMVDNSGAGVNDNFACVVDDLPLSR